MKPEDLIEVLEDDPNFLALTHDLYGVRVWVIRDEENRSADMPGPVWELAYMGKKAFVNRGAKVRRQFGHMKLDWGNRKGSDRIIRRKW